MKLFIYNGTVIPCADEYADACRRDYGITDKGITVSESEWNEAGGLARIVNGKIFIGKTTEEKLADSQAEIRRKRDALLVSEVDPVQSRTLYWAELPEEKKEMWRTYRRALLDITEQPEFAKSPASVSWPQRPE